MKGSVVKTFSPQEVGKNTAICIATHGIEYDFFMDFSTHVTVYEDGIELFSERVDRCINAHQKEKGVFDIELAGPRTKELKVVLNNVPESLINNVSISLVNRLVRSSSFV